MKRAASKVKIEAEQHNLFINSSKAIEHHFPIKQISQLAQQESWRKEVNRPIYHIHKWWAQRLGSVFRAIILGVLAGPYVDIWENFYKKHDFNGKIILDPFMGSGTTLGECAKLGAKPIGVDINPVSSFIVKQALMPVDITELERIFGEIEANVKEKIQHYYKTIDPITGEEILALYYFWVKQVTTPKGENIPLFSSYVFSKDAYPKKKPIAKIICPSCWNINYEKYDAVSLVCCACKHHFNPQKGRAEGQYVTDLSGVKYKIKDLINASKSPPSHKLYAILALRNDGTKVYSCPTSYDFKLLQEVKDRLKKEDIPLPDMVIRDGYNTNQARSYNYLNWRDFFNERQLLSLGLLLKSILQIKNKIIREQFLCLFSSTLEFNNLFCSFKGEGTGAVRHLFSHHILKPERTPLENSVWGTDKSSGTFSTLYRSRLLKAKQYLEQPFELSIFHKGDEKVRSSEKVVCSDPLSFIVTESWEEFGNKPKSALVLNGDSGKLIIPDQSVDAVITDPPYFDFVHYSELSDFFYAWLAPVLKKDYNYFSSADSSNSNEVQSRSPAEFTLRLAKVFQECHRVLKKEGLLSFSFHHSRIEGWLSIYNAISTAGFNIVAVYPIYGEMMGANPKSSTKEPISLDAILICKKNKKVRSNKNIVSTIMEKTREISKELTSSGIKLSQSDYFVIRMSSALMEGSLCGYKSDEMLLLLKQIVAI